ncbi:serine hydrolase domain-containing protein [Novosphingobium lentum]|uniref:serine hydrolase domain-containing protein n=1 Tax=Novosphingobium lentum TaxID=145287 RepID=UPI000AB3D801|nr:serine hydrolase [Novosphingobium lentum]
MVRRSCILPLLMLPALIGCGKATAPVAPPLDQAAMAAVVENPGVDRDVLARSVDALFTDPAAAETRAVVVMLGGRIVAERYAAGYHENTRFVSWSMAKSITGVMIGLLVSDGRLRLNQPAPVAAWQRPGDPRGEITLRQLLQMRSGLRHVENGDPIYTSDEVRMLFLDGRGDMARYAENQPLEVEPGAKWKYSTATSVILADLAARALAPDGDAETRRRAVSEYLRTRLFEPVGMKSMLPEFDASGTLIGGSLIHGRARDWAKFGEFLRNEGAVAGAQIIPRAWIEFMTAPSPRQPEYGAQIWLNRKPSGNEPAALFPDQGPASLFACVGHLGQYVLVSPKQKLVVVRLGKTQEPQMPAVVHHLAEIVAQFPAS